MGNKMEKLEFEKNCSEWNSGSWRDLKFEDLSYDQILRLKLFLEEEVTRIKLQITGAKSKAKQSGDYSDISWFRNANYAAKMRGIALNKLNYLAKIKKPEKAKKNADRSVSWERMFIRVSRRELSGREFDRFCELTDIEMDDEQ